MIEKHEHFPLWAWTARPARHHVVSMSRLLLWAQPDGRSRVCVVLLPLVVAPDHQSGIRRSAASPAEPTAGHADQAPKAIEPVVPLRRRKEIVSSEGGWMLAARLSWQRAHALASSTRRPEWSLRPSIRPLVKAIFLLLLRGNFRCVALPASGHRSMPGLLCTEQQRPWVCVNDSTAFNARERTYTKSRHGGGDHFTC